MSRQHKKQHKVPRTYLEAFTNKDGRVWVADNKMRLFSQKPKNILTENDFYTVRFPDGGGTLKVETEFLGGIEATYSIIYQEKIFKHLPLSKTEKAAMAIFVAATLERSPRRREALQDGFDQVRDITEKMRAMVAGMTPEEKKAFEAAQTPVSEESRRNSTPADEFLKAGEDVASFHSAGIPEGVVATAPLIFEMRWTFLIRPEGAEPFVTSDSPCTLDNPSLPPRSIYGPGLGQKNIEVCMPLSPDLALMCGWLFDKDWGYVPGTVKEVNEINRRVMRRSETLVSNDRAMLERQITRIKEYLEAKKAKVNE